MVVPLVIVLLNGNRAAQPRQANCQVRSGEPTGTWFFSKVEEGGVKRMVITLNGKWLEYKKF